MKSIFLSMLAIAALASCTKENFNVDPPVPQGEKMLVDITLSSGKKTKAAGPATAAQDKTIDNVTVFFLNATDQIVSKHYVNSVGLTEDETDPAAKTATIETRSTAVNMMVIANIGESRVGTGGTLDVATRAQLVKVVQDLATTAPPLNPVQVKGDVLMSGEGTVNDMTPQEGGASTADASATLNFIPAKITLAKIALGADVQGVYNTDFKFTRAFLLNVQTKSHYFPTTNSYIPDPKAYANGVAWEASWSNPDPHYPVVTDFNQALNFPDMEAAKTDIAHWYVFENDPASVVPADNPTTLVIEVEWTKTKANPGAGVEEEKVKKLFNVIFAPGDKGAIEAGKAYNVDLTFNGDFRPESEGGNGGGGDDDPDKPNISANVGITVAPAEWADTSTPKPFE